MSADLGKRIRETVIESGNTQARFAKSIGVYPSNLSRWIKGESAPSNDYLINISIIGNVTIDWLLTGKEPKRRGEISNTRQSAHLKSGDEVSERSDEKEDEKRVPESVHEDEQSIVQQIEALLAGQKTGNKIRFAEPPGEEYDAEYTYTMRLLETQQLLSEISKLPREKRAEALRALLATAKIMSGRS